MNFSNSPRSTLFWLTGGWLVWSSCFVALYAVLSLGCELGWQHRPLPGWHVLGYALVSTWLLHLLAQAGLMARIVLNPETGLSTPRSASEKNHQPPSLAKCEAASRAGSLATNWVASMSATLCGLSMLATLWTGWPLVVLPACS